MNIKELAQRAELRKGRLENALDFFETSEDFVMLKKSFNLAMLQIEDLEKLLKLMTDSSTMWHECYKSERKQNSEIYIKSPVNSQQNLIVRLIIHINVNSWIIIIKKLSFQFTKLNS